MEKWGRADNFRYTCCFIWVDASLPVLDKYINTRVDCMINAGLLNEVCDIYKPNSDYTQGIRQAIGVREFEEFIRVYSINNKALDQSSVENANIYIPNSWSATDTKKQNLLDILHSKDSELHNLLVEAIDKFKANTRKLVRRQKRRLTRLKTDFSWNVNYIDGTKVFSDDAVNLWSACVVEPCVKIVGSFLLGAYPLTPKEKSNVIPCQQLESRDLCTQYVCEACGNRVLRGAHEWEQHKKGRVHRKRFLRFKKTFRLVAGQQPDNYAETLLQAGS